MASFPTETLTRIGAAYDEALIALQNSDLDPVRVLMDEVDRLTSELPDLALAPTEPHDQQLLAQTRERHERLLTAITADHSKTQASLQKASHGRRALKGYGNRTDQTGNHIESLS